MAYPVGKPAHNRLTWEKVETECILRNHTLLGYDHPFVKVKCHCGNEYEQKLHSYKAAKNSCKVCLRKSRSRPRPDHALKVSWKPRSHEVDLPAILGLIEYRDKEGIHLKVGITKYDSLKKRYGKRHVRTIAEYRAPLGECFMAEQAILAEAERRGWRRRSSTTTELIHPDGFSEVREWVLQGGLGGPQSD